MALLHVLHVVLKTLQAVWEKSSREVTGLTVEVVGGIMGVDVGCVMVVVGDHLTL